MPYNGSSNGSGGGSGGGGIMVSDGPQNKKIRTGVQQSLEGDAHMHVMVSLMLSLSISLTKNI